MRNSCCPMDPSLLDWIELYSRIALGLTLFMISEWGIPILLVGFVVLFIWLAYCYVKKVRIP